MAAIFHLKKDEPNRLANCCIISIILHPSFKRMRYFYGKAAVSTFAIYDANTET